MAGPVETRIREKLQKALSATHFELENESYKHSVPKGSETHFRLVVVSERFKGLSRVARQRLIYEILGDEIAPGGIHALSQKAFAPDEWQGSADDFQSPDCLGGSKADKS